MKKSLGAKVIISATHVWVIGTYDNEGKPNIMTAALGGVCYSQPPCVAASLSRPCSGCRHDPVGIPGCISHEKVQKKIGPNHLLQEV